MGAYVAAQTNLSIQYLLGGIYPGAPGYTISIEGSSFIAKDANGQIDFSGTNSTTVIQNSIDALTNGGSILLKQGTYGEDGVAIQLHEGVHLYGEGSTYAPFGEGGGFAIPNIPPTRFRGRIGIIGGSTDITSTMGVGVHDIGIVPSTDRNSYEEAAIFIQQSMFTVIERVSIARYHTGILLTTLDQANSYNEAVQILYTSIYNATYGIKLTTLGAGWKSDATVIQSCIIVGHPSNMTAGIKLDTGDYTTIDDVSIWNAEVGIVMSDSLNYIRDINFQTVGTGIHLNMSTEINQIVSISAIKHSGVTNLINDHGTIYNDVSAYEKNCGRFLATWGQRKLYTEFGVATGTSPIEVGHNLASTAIYVVLGPMGTTPFSASWATINATAFYIYHDAGGSASVSWYASYLSDS